MARQLVSPLMEILSRDINNFRKSADKTLLEVVLGNALPRIPSFIAGGFNATISGNNVVVAPGICFQKIDQTDGSTNIRIAHLETAKTLAITLASTSGVTKTDLIECRSIITNLPTQSRKFNEPGGVVSKNVVVQNKWDAEVRVRQNVTANVSGGYDASEGWVAVALVKSNNTVVESIEDLRDFYNLFDPDFFSVYGRKNIALKQKYDGINLIQAPFEFSDLVSKLSQVSVRRRYKGTFGQIPVTNKYNTSFSLTAPTSGSITLKSKDQWTFLGSLSTILSLNISSGYWAIRGALRERWELVYPTTLFRNSLYKYDSNWNSGSFNPQDVWGFSVSTHQYSKNRLTNSNYDERVSNRGRMAVSGDTGRGLTRTSGESSLVASVSSTQFSQIPTTGIYILLTNSSTGIVNNSLQYLVWNIPKSSLGVGSNDLYINDNFFSYPIGKNIDWSSRIKYFSLTTVNPLSQSSGTTTYTRSADLSITNYWTLDSFTYNPATKSISFALKVPSSGVLSARQNFPLEGAVFNRLIIKKGTETRLTKNFTDLTVSVSGTTATYTYNLTSLDTLIKNTDTAYNDFNIEFEVLGTTGEDVWRSDLLRGGTTLGPTVDYKVEEEGSKTHVRLNDQYPFGIDDEVLISHIIPQELIDAGSGGTPEEQTANAQITALRNQLNALTAKVNTNETDIDALERTSTSTQTTFYHGLIALTPKNNANKTISTSGTSLLPLAQAEFNNPTERIAKQVNSLLLSGGFLQFNAPQTSGYYNPWIAVKPGDYTNLQFRTTQDDTDNWSNVGTSTLGGDTYNIFVRIRPVLQGRSLKLYIKDYE